MAELTLHDWRWVCQNLSTSKGVEEVSGVQLVETVVLDPTTGVPQRVVNLGNSGHLQSYESAKYLQLPKIYERFSRICAQQIRQVGANQITEAEQKAALLIAEDGTLQVLTRADLKAYVQKGSFGPGMVCVQAYLYPKGAGGNAGVLEAASSDRREPIANVAPPPVHLRCELFFTKDNDRRFKQTVVLSSGAAGMGTHVSEVRSRNKHTNDQMAAITLSVAKALERRHPGQRVTEMVAEFTLDHNETVWLVRTAKCAMTSMEGFNASVTALSFDGTESTALLERTTKTRRRKKKAGATAGLDGSLRTQSQGALNRTDPPTVSRRRQRTSKPKGRGANVVCPGSFCGYDARFITGDDPLESMEDDILAAVDSGSRHSSTMFRNRMASPSMSTADSSFTDTISLMSDFGPRSVSLGDGEGRVVSKRMIHIVQREKKLVDSLLRRHRNGEPSDYLHGAQESDLIDDKAERRPANIYESVRVCPTCFRVYNLVEKSRTQALEKAAKQHARRGHRRRRRKVSEHGNPEDDASETSSLTTHEPFHAVDPFNIGSDSVTAAGDQGPSLDGERSIKQAERAITSLTKNDLAELRSFTRPPPAVEMVAAALMTMLTGAPLSWDQTRRVIANGDRFLKTLREYSLNDLTPSRMRRVQSYLENPHFNPGTIAPISRAAAKFCAWILGMVQAAQWRAGRGHERINPLTGGTMFPPIGTPGRESRGRNPEKNGALTFAEKLALKKKQKLETDTSYFQESWASYKNLGTTYDDESSFATGFTKGTKGTTKKDVILAQQRQMEKLATQSYDAEVHLPGGGKAGEQMFQTKDGTEMPFRVLGRIGSEVTNVNFVVVNDFFDTLEISEIMLKQTLRDHQLAQALVFNYPGQFGATGRSVNNDQVSGYLHELLGHVEKKGLMLIKSKPFHLMAFGNGVAIALAFVVNHGNRYQGSLRSLVSVNGFAGVDAQLAAIMHSSLRFFESFPPNRPDLPVSYFTKFLFSEGYLKKVPLNLALSLYTAISNHITLAGRVQICKGVLQHRDLTKELKRIRIPLVIVQSTEDVLVNPANVDSFLEGRSVNYLYNHQINTNAPSGKNCLGSDGISHLMTSLSKNNGAFLLWVKAGHEIRQEARRVVTDLLDVLCCPTTEHTKVHVPSSSSTLTLHPSSNFIAHISGKKLKVKESEQKTEEDSLQKKDMEAAKQKKKKKTQDTTQEPDASMSADELLDFSAVRDISQPAIPPRIGAAGTEEVPSVEVTEQPKPKESTVRERRRRRRRQQRSIAQQQSAEETGSMGSVRIDLQPQEGLDKPRTSSFTDDSNLPPRVQAHEELAGAFSPVSGTLGDVTASQKSPYGLSQVHEVRVGPLPSVTGKDLPDFEATEEMKEKRAWADEVPTAAEVLAEVSNIEKVTRAALAEMQLKSALEIGGSEESKNENAASRLMRIEREQELRRKRMAEEEMQIMQRMELDLAQRRIENASMQRRAEIDDIEADLVAKGIIPAYLAPAGGRHPVRTMRPKEYGEPPDLPSHFREPASDIDKLFAELDAMEKESRNKGFAKIQDYQKVKQRMEEAKFEEEAKLKNAMASDQQKMMAAMALRIQRVVRGALGRRKAKNKRELKFMDAAKKEAALKITAVGRGYLGRKRFRQKQDLYVQEIMMGGCARDIQRVVRGHFARRLVHGIRRERAIRLIQRVYRGHCGRSEARFIRARLEELRRRNLAATKLQSAWRMNRQWLAYETLRVQSLAVTEIQRVFRGHISRKKVKRRQEWDAAEPGPERMRLGIRMLEESKLAFDRQQAEIDALHRSQEKAELRISHIHGELKDAELELSVLEREMTEVDHIEKDLAQLTHERDLLQRGIVEDAAGLGNAAHMDVGAKRVSNAGGMMDERERNARQRALDIQLQMKRAERDKRRQELETEFASVYEEVSRKKMELSRLEGALADLEATRARKEREFARIQKNLMDLLQEQKYELDALREKGVELELASASTAAAAAATAAKAKQSQEKSNAMMSQTEELMKFQFMSMSLSYFSGLNMLGQMRDMNADTTQAAVAGAAEAAAAAAAVSSAASLPQLNDGALAQSGYEIAQQVAAKKRAELADQKRAERDAKIARDSAFPDDLSLWTTQDVGRWLNTLNLGQYVKAFEEGAVDGKFLMDLRDHDIAHLLGVAHPLHVRKIMVNRDRLMPLTPEELEKKSRVKEEKAADVDREIPDPDTVFSQVRNNRLKRVEAALTAGFEVNKEDERGNSLLMIACQNLNRRMCELLLARGANINHKNAVGNTALHFAMTYDSEGTLGEFLIMHGADDSIENNDGLSPYDGIG